MAAAVDHRRRGCPHLGIACTARDEGGFLRALHRPWPVAAGRLARRPGPIRGPDDGVRFPDRCTVWLASLDVHLARTLHLRAAHHCWLYRRRADRLAHGLGDQSGFDTAIGVVAISAIV